MSGRRLLVLVAVVGVVALAGCSAGGDTTTTASDVSTDTTTPDTAGTDTPADTDPSSTDSEVTTAGPDTTTTEAGPGTDSNTTGTDPGTDTTEPSPGTTDNATDTDTTEADTGIQVRPSSFAAGDVTDAAIAASRDVEQYRAVRNLTTTTVSNNVERPTEQHQVVDLNRTGERFQQSATVSARGRTVETDVYLVNGTQYTRGQGNTRVFGSEWVRIDLGENASRVLELQDALRSTRQYLANASVSAAGEATVEGTDVYVLEADFREDDYLAVRSSTSPFGNGTTVYDASGRYYISQDTGRIQRFTLAANWTSEFGGSTLDRSIEGVTDFDYEPVSVTLPEAADGAVDISDDGNETDTDGNETTADRPGETTSEADDEAVDDPAESNGIAVREGTLAVDPDTTFTRIEFVLGTNVTEPDAVTVLPERTVPANVTGLGDLLDVRTFGETVGMDRESIAGRNVSMGAADVRPEWLAGVSVGGYGSVNLRSSDAMPTWLVRLLATHEMVHYVQLQNGWITAANNGTDATTDGRFAASAVVEGGATYLTDEIRALYAFGGPRNAQLYEGIDALVDAGTTTAYGNRQYSDGARYVDNRIDRPDRLSKVYRTPPTTSEQVLHNYSVGSEPPVDMNVSVETGEAYVPGETDRKGEAYTRHVLANGVDFETASAAAAGWGNDTVVTLRSTGAGNASYVWIQRWDDSQNATQFATTAREYLDTYGNATDGTPTLGGLPATLRTVDDRTTALVIGPSSLQDRVSLTADGGTVVVETD